MGIANTTPSSAITSVITGKSVEDITGRGTGINDDAWKNKVQVIKDSIEINKPDSSDPIDLLAKLGGAEIAGIAGLVIGAAANKVPVVVDGFGPCCCGRFHLNSRRIDRVFNRTENKGLYVCCPYVTGDRT
jgi:nicotinate-nucleotide--dimethylbenzimidazole phosphoribosyltransferase